MERTLVSEREFRRAVVIARAVARELTSEQAAELLCLSSRQVKRLRKRYLAGGEKALVHASAGRSSNHCRAAEERERVIELISARYGGSAESGPGQRFGPTLVSEQLREDEGILVPVSTLTDWMRAAGLWSRVRKRRPHRRRRERKAHFGEMVQLDGSFHDWLEGRGAVACLMTMTDDATGTMLARFSPAESFWGAIAVLKRWILQYGVPRVLYTDWKTLYHPLSTGPRTAETQFGRICSRLGMELIPASSPQAKGRVERTHGTNQDRLVKKLRLQGISDYAPANEYLEQSYIAAHNARFAREPASAADYHLPADPRSKERDLWCREETRRVSNDAVISYGSRKLLLTLRRDMPPKARVLVRETEDSKLRVIYCNTSGREYELSWSPYVESPRVFIATPRCWSPASRPRPDHPWRRQIHAESLERIREKTLTPVG